MPSIKKHQPSPVSAMTMPATEGPIKRARFTIDELSAMALPSSDEDARDRTEEKCRELSREPDGAEHQRGAGQSIDQPVRRGGRDPRADERDDLAEEEEPVIAGAQRPQHEGDRCLRTRGHSLNDTRNERS